jgi:hypothetical protein
MSAIDIDESEGQSPLTLYLYSRHLFYLACGSSHLYGSSLSLKLLSLHSKLSKGCALRPKASLKRWIGPQVTWLAFQVTLASSRILRSLEHNRIQYVFHRLVVSCKICSIFFAKFV